jgi:hypothetical protein
VVPPQARFAEAYEIGLSSQATTVSIAGKVFTDDAGTTDYFDGLLKLDGTNYSNKFVLARAAIIDSPKGTQSVYDGFCDYDVFGFGCHKSYLIADFNVWDAAGPRSEVRTSSAASIYGSHATATPVDWVMSWGETGQLYVGSPLAGSRTLRAARVPTGGAFASGTRIANAGGALNAVVYVANPVTGQLNGVLVCAP